MADGVFRLGRLQQGALGVIELITERLRPVGDAPPPSQVKRGVVGEAFDVPIAKDVAVLPAMQLRPCDLKAGRWQGRGLGHGELHSLPDLSL